VARAEAGTAGPAFEHPDQNRIHEFVVVWNVQADDPFAPQAGAEFPVQLAAVGLLHDEDDVGPLDLFGRRRHQALRIVDAASLGTAVGAGASLDSIRRVGLQHLDFKTTLNRVPSFDIDRC
jgi:hypothetical protein